MRWSIVRLIWFRELRDQLRDRRTLFMIAVLPVFLYPIAGFGLMQLALGFLKKSSVVEVQGADNLPPPSPFPAASLFALTSPPPGIPLAGIERLTGAFALRQTRLGGEAPFDYPPLFVKDNGALRVAPAYFDSPDEAKTLEIIFSKTPPPDEDPASPAFLERIDRSSLTSRQADLLLVVPPHFKEDLEAAKQPKMFVLVRLSDERSRLVNTRLNNVLHRWSRALADVRLVRLGLPANYDEPFVVTDPEKAKPSSKRAADELFDVLVRVFPFILVMWSLAGALYPAVDLCAGEKERGTMETLLISPASREEIVWGKFLTIWVFSAATALLNLFSMGLTTMQFSSMIKLEAFNPLSLLWGVLLLLPLSAFFSAVCLSIGAYARSSKEGQYYLMPLFLLTMPLIFLTLAPDVTLNPFYSMVPITGVALLLQKLMAAGTPSGELMVYFIPVLGPMVLYSWLALRWAIEQFQREEVLFREAERLDLGLWLRSLFREKEALPTTGQALFCFALVIGLVRLSISFGEQYPLMVQLGVRYLAFVATPPLFMALLLTTRPRLALRLRLPPWWAWPVAVALAALLFLPGLEYAHFILDQIPAMKVSLEEHLRSQSGVLPASPAGSSWLTAHWDAFLVVVVLQSVCEELAFRGFIFSGLRRRFKPWTAVFISSFLFALSQLNVFQFVPHFVAGVAMALLVVRTGSIFPAMLCHLVYNGFVMGPLLFPEANALFGYADLNGDGAATVRIVLGILGLTGAAALLFVVWRLTPTTNGFAKDDR
jgi:sodium transport system permease protein